MMHESLLRNEELVNAAFSKQAPTYDAHDSANPILIDLRRQVYEHVEKYLKPQSHILELNAGTGIDAVHFVKGGHTVHATDLSDGMIAEIQKKVFEKGLHSRLLYEQLSYTRVDQVRSEKKFDYVFSNFGGLNCISDLKIVTSKIESILTPGAYVTFVIMPKVYLWELGRIFIGDFKQGMRRLRKNGVQANVDGKHFRTYYHSLEDIKKSFSAPFKFIASEALAALTPAPHRSNFPVSNPKLYAALKWIDRKVRYSFPFNRCADHLIVTFRFDPK
jgi:ubiquinone/menaquinone biosynthesis C-methylase UbiE